MRSKQIFLIDSNGKEQETHIMPLSQGIGTGQRCLVKYDFYCRPELIERYFSTAAGQNAVMLSQSERPFYFALCNCSVEVEVQLCESPSPYAGKYSCTCILYGDDLKDINDCVRAFENMFELNKIMTILPTQRF